MTNDKILIRDLKLETIIGLFPWEREVRQTLLIDLDIGTDIRAAAESNNLNDTINYAEICERIAKLADEGRYKLIESLAEKISTLVIEEFHALDVKVTIYKQDVMTQVAKVGVSIERKK